MNQLELIEALKGADTDDALMQELLTRIKDGSVIVLPACEVNSSTGTRYREERVVVRTTWNDVGQIEQIVATPTGIMQRRVLNTMERQTRDALTAQGWTPPRGR